MPYAELRLWAPATERRVDAQTGLAEFVLDTLQSGGFTLQDGDGLVLAQKIVSKAEDRRVNLRDVEPSASAVQLAVKTGKDERLVELILRESSAVLRAQPGVLIVRHRLGFVCANAGIDQSNAGNADADEFALLLPENPDASAQRLREALLQRSGVRVAVLIADSLGRAWRQGTIGTAIGIAGAPALVDLRGRHDLDGRALRSSELGFADELASAASLLMGQAAEGRPIVLVRGLAWPCGDGRAVELIRSVEKDLFP
ncbi:MAG: cofE [Nevskia sp.]|nr:cofE [Nevskia sp.]